VVPLVVAILVIRVSTIHVVELIFAALVISPGALVIAPELLIIISVVVPLFVTSTKVKLPQRIIWVRVSNSSSPVRPVEPRWFRAIHVHLIGVPVLIINPSVSIKETIDLHSEVSGCRTTPLPVDADLEIIISFVGVRAHDDWIVVRLVIVLVPLLACSLVSYLDVNEWHTEFSRFPATFGNVNLEE